jgi:hypothetical protein
VDKNIPEVGNRHRSDYVVGMTKLPATHLTTVRFTDEQLAWLRDEANRQDRSIGWIVRDIIEQTRRTGGRRREKVAASATGR